MMVEFGGNATVYSLLPLQKIHKIAKPLCYFVLFEERRKEEEKNPVRDISFFFILSIYSKQGSEKSYLLLSWTIVRGKVGYQAWQEVCYVW